ncbi:40S ribosomal uS9 domain-containing protein [Aspergillus mulundensis]|uniref:40S ribosomal protein S16 n=1 Tax=Aspergillus mulundensis TaxID=1810919 RepID=A0A3D8SWM1_9EURO|nr:Uncharacterized protein DSM5745_02492 [Aspergillus mulundensis]RDW90717.1 Uncharacterized protein DSM5745_02492 [Aspergillus mulundensis]
MASVPSVQCFGKKKTGIEDGLRSGEEEVENDEDTGNDHHRWTTPNARRTDFAPETRPRPVRDLILQTNTTHGLKGTTQLTTAQQGKGLIKVNGQPLQLVQPEILRFKAYEPVLIVGADKFAGVDIRVRVTGGGHTSQVYAIRQAIAKSLVAYYQKYVDEHSKNQLKQAFVQYDRTLLVADNRRAEPKKFGGRGARARYQKSYR